jgi:hypothetical protein
MSENGDADGEEPYRVGPKTPSGAAFGLAESACDDLAGLLERLTCSSALDVRVVPSGEMALVRFELMATDAMGLAEVLGRMVQARGLATGKAAGGLDGTGDYSGTEIDDVRLHPMWSAMHSGTDYMPGLELAFEARAWLREVLCACLPRGPLAISPTAEDGGAGVVRVDLTPADARALVELLSRAAGCRARGEGA